jgi:hypothetical protein
MLFATMVVRSAPRQLSHPFAFLCVHRSGLSSTLLRPLGHGVAPCPSRVAVLFVAAGFVDRISAVADPRLDDRLALVDDASAAPAPMAMPAAVMPVARLVNGLGYKAHPGSVHRSGLFLTA